MLPSDFFISNLYSQLGYFLGKFQALQLIAFPVFGAECLPLASCILVYVLEISFQQHLDGKVQGANMGLIWGWQDPGGPHVGPMNLLSGQLICKFHITETPFSFSLIILCICIYIYINISQKHY